MYVGDYHIKLDRSVSQDYIKNMNIDWMPGFRITWNYNKKIEAGTMFSNDDRTKEFVRLE